MKNNEMKSFLLSLIYELNMIKKYSNEKQTISSLDNILNKLNEFKGDIDNKELTNFAKQLMYREMKALYYSNPERSRKLYVIYQELKSERISVEEALNKIYE